MLSEELRLWENGVGWVPGSGMMAEYQSAVCHCAIIAPSFRILRGCGDWERDT